MRKRIIIGLVAVVVIGVAALFLSQPKEGSVAWHKREYWAAKKALRPSWQYRLRTEYHRLTRTPDRRPVRGCESDELTQKVIKMMTSWDALVEHGYLTRKEFFLIHQPMSRVANHLKRAAQAEFSADTIWELRSTSFENSIIVYAPLADRSKWEELIRKADVPDVPEVGK